MILLLEDEPDAAKVVRLILRPKGYVVLETPAAETAVGLGCTEDIDLLIADVMPPCSGIHVAFQLKARKPDLRIILTSGHSPGRWNKRQRAEFSEMPSDSVRVLQKPFFPAELLRTVNELIYSGAITPTVAVGHRD